MYSFSIDSPDGSDVTGHLSTAPAAPPAPAVPAEDLPLSAWAPMPGDETCPLCGRRLAWTGGMPAHRYAGGDLDRCSFDRASGSAS